MAEAKLAANRRSDPARKPLFGGGYDPRRPIARGYDGGRGLGPRRGHFVGAIPTGRRRRPAYPARGSDRSPAYRKRLVLQPSVTAPVRPRLVGRVFPHFHWVIPPQSLCGIVEFRFSNVGEGGTLSGRMEIRKIILSRGGCLRGNAEIGCAYPDFGRKGEWGFSMVPQ